MDPLAQAFAYYEWDPDAGRIIFTNNVVQGKYLINSTTFPLGYITPDDHWTNYWRAGKNAALGWRTTQADGFGAKSLGNEIASSRAFSTCQVKKAFRAVCFRDPANPAERNEVNRIADVFEANNYSMKRVFAEVAGFCKGLQRKDKRNISDAKDNMASWHKTNALKEHYHSMSNQWECRND